MADFKNSRKWRFFAHSPAFILLLAALSTVLVLNLFDIIPKAGITADNKRVALSELKELESRKMALEEELAKLGTEEGVEEKIREKFRVVRGGEGLVVIVDDGKSENTAEEPGKRRGFLDFLKNLFQ